MRRTIGVLFVVIAYLLLLYTALAAPAYGRAHSHLNLTMLAAYSAPWPVAMTSAFALMGLVLAVVPVRRGEKWALATCLLTFILLLAVRLATDPRCLVVLDPRQHGCHTFMILSVTGITGLLLSWRR